MSNRSSRHVYAVIMAGGIGKKLWPLSRRKMPKQFVDLLDDGTMVAKTVRRISGLVREENIFIITSELGRSLLSSSLGSFRQENIIVEPSSRNTAPCIALATAHIKKRDPDAVTIVLPSDHLVLDDRTFINILEAGIEIAAEKKGLVTIGIKPDRPETAYGYIQADGQLPLPLAFSDGCEFLLFRVKAFAEKPDASTAVEFLESNDFYWNSGVFIWHIEAISREFERSMPDLYKDLLAIYDSLGSENEQKVIEDVYSWIHPRSIDYGIMEKAETVFVLTGEFGWTDLGCWDEVLKVAGSRSTFSGELPDNRLVQIDCKNVFVKNSPGKVVCTIGLEDVIIVETENALLVCSKGNSHRVGEVVDTLRREGLEEYL
ncbi:MAG: mannose-1-phosphate guanyltransferase [Chlorobiaceae bacterium]|nr:mannose-1-phosphate guanyltransferase [Chlorobiaceae bacterium]NTV17067.1 mannose-1-phosphate guanyltransferase [Chlorobiaceae bacterium]